ncbi:hypothetical protein ACFE04_000275 [Oxalis oulophora]
MENLDIRARSSQARLIGTIISNFGALVVTLYKGIPIILSSNSLNVPGELLVSAQSNWLIGSILLAVGGFFLALLYIVLTLVIKEYPEELVVTAIYCFFVALLSAAVSLFVERDPDAWKPQPNIGLIAIIYTAVHTAIVCVMHSWTSKKKGPVFTCSFKPLSIIFPTAMGIALLGDSLYLGSVIGAAAIAVGFYAVLWGQPELEKTVNSCNLASSSLKAHLLPAKRLEN